MKKWIFIACLVTLSVIHAKTEDDADRIKEGNLALPPSQQPGPLFGFGQNIIQQGALQFFTIIPSFQGHNLHLTNVIPALLYGIRDDLSIFINIPIVARFRRNNQCSSGISDILAQLEYAVFNKDSATAADQITLVGNITIPSGSSSKIPPTGFGSMSIFLGFTASHMALDWYLFTSQGAVITTSNQQTKFGHQVLYQFGLGKNIVGAENRYTITWLLEMNGIWSERNLIHGTPDNNLETNIIFLGPSLFVSFPHLLVQGGIAFPVLQNLGAQQVRGRFLSEVQIAWTF